MEDAIGLQGQGGGVLLTQGGICLFFLLGGHFSSKLFTSQVKVLASFVRIQLSVQTSEQCLVEVRLLQQGASAVTLTT